MFISPQPQVPLSILQWLRKYFQYWGMDEDANILRLEERPLVDAHALDCTLSVVSPRPPVLSACCGIRIRMMMYVLTWEWMHY